MIWIGDKTTDKLIMELRLNSLFFSAILFFLTAGFGFSEEKIHVMGQGETIYSVSRSYGVSPQEVLSLNKISDARTVQVGARIRIPGAAIAAETANPAYDEHRVEKNDTLYSLARRYGISLAELLEINGITSSHVLKIGEKIRVPARGSGNTGETPVNTTPAQLDPSVRWPIKAKEISYITGKLYGVQVTGERQEGVKSLTGGTVVTAGPFRGFGRVAIVQTESGYLYVYGGCETLSVKEGDKVVSGTELGKLGIDNKSAKFQLFLFVFRGNTPIDPAKAPRA